jgi:D-alanine-D-alanine ligase
MNVLILANIGKEIENIETYTSKEIRFLEDIFRKGRHQAIHLNMSNFSLSSFVARIQNMKKKKRFNIIFNLCESFQGNSKFETYIPCILEMMDIPFTGSGFRALSLTNDKSRIKRIFKYHNIPTPRFQIFRSPNERLKRDLRFPLIIKPIREGGSIGISEESVVYSKKRLREKVHGIMKAYSEPALVEEFINGRELTIGIIGNSKPRVLPIVEKTIENISPKLSNFYTYDAKWQTGIEPLIVKSVCPADIKLTMKKRIGALALKIYKIFHIQDYGRIDVKLLDKKVFFLEVNANPGIDSCQEIPYAALAVGMKYNRLILKVLEYAAERYSIK